SRCHSRLLSSFLSYFTDPATTPIYTLSLHDALPISSLGLDLAPISEVRAMAGRVIEIRLSNPVPMLLQLLAQPELTLSRGGAGRSEEHTSELQSRENLVCRLLLEKKKDIGNDKSTRT